MTTYNRINMTYDEIAEGTFGIETKKLNETAGKQDPYISALVEFLSFKLINLVKSVRSL